jgi:hypothetical protein
LEGFAVFVWGTFAGEDGLGLGEKHGHGGSEFVGGIGGEPGLAGKSGLELGKGVVESQGQLIEFRVSGRIRSRDPFRELSLGDLLGCVRDSGDGFQGTGKNPVFSEQPGQENQASGEDQRCGKRIVGIGVRKRAYENGFNGGSE